MNCSKCGAKGHMMNECWKGIECGYFHKVVHPDDKLWVKNDVGRMRQHVSAT